MQRFLGGLFRQSSDPLPIVQRSDIVLPQPITRKVLVITHNPVLHTQGNQTLKEYFHWQDPHRLAQGYINDIREISFGYANYEIVEHLEVDAYPIKRDGFRYTEQSYLEAWRTHSFHDP